MFLEKEEIVENCNLNCQLIQTQDSNILGNCSDKKEGDITFQMNAFETSVIKVCVAQDNILYSTYVASKQMTSLLMLSC